MTRISLTHCWICVLSLAVAAQITVAQKIPQQPEPVAKRQSDETSKADAGEAQNPTGQKPKPAVDLSNPRATMRSFLVAVQDAAGEHPERIDDAVACLDLSGLEGDDRAEQARSLARRLHALIDKHGVNLDDIPEETDQFEFVFPILETKKQGTPEIQIRRNFQTDQWHFTAQTLAWIPALEKGLTAKVEEPRPTKSDVPAAHRSPRATMNAFLEAMNAKPPAIEDAIACLDPSGQDREAWGIRGKTLATKLKNVMDKIKLVVLSEIPDAPDGPPYVWFNGKRGNIVIGKIADVGQFTKDWRFIPQVGEWRFTPQTLKTLGALYQEYESQPIIRELREVGRKEELTFGLRLQRQMPKWLRQEFIGLQGWQWVALAVLLPVGWIIKAIVALIARLFLQNWLGRRKIDIDREKQRGVMRSFGIAAAVLFWHLAIQHLDLPSGVFGVLFRSTQLAFAVTAIWAGYRLVDVLGGYIVSNKDIRLTQFDEVLVPLLSKILRMLVVVVVVLFVFEWCGYTPTTVLGALGIGGVALAFAAQDTLGNFFGSITVLFDRPFDIGDWIVIGDIEGTVERVGFRSTRVRTFYNSVVTIPNSRMVNTNVDNYGARHYRRARVMISVTYSTPPEKIDAFCEGIRELIRLHPYTRKDYYHVYFNQFAPSSLDILLYVFFEVPDWGTELRERHRLFIDIMRLAKRLGIEFAFPTQTLFLQRSRQEPPPTEPQPMSMADPDRVGLDEAARVFEEAYGMGPPDRTPVVIESAPRSKGNQKA